MSFLLPVAPLIIGSATSAGVSNWFSNNRQSANIIGDRQYDITQRQIQEDQQIQRLSDTRNQLLKEQERQQFNNKIELAKQKIDQIRQKQKPQEQKPQEQKPQEKTTEQKLKEVRQKIKDNLREESKGDERVDQMVQRERNELLHEEAELSQQYYRERGLADMSNIPKPSKKDVEKLKKEASDKFSDKMSKMTDLRKQRDGANKQQKEQIQKQLNDMRAKPKTVRDFSDDQLQDIQELNRQMRRINLNPNRIDEIMEQIQREGIQPYNSYSPQDPRNFLRRPIGEYKKPDNEPDNEPDNDPNPDNDPPNNEHFIPQDQETRFDYIQSFNKIMGIIQNKKKQSLEQQHKEIDEITKDMPDNKIVNIYNMIDNIKDEHIPQIENNTIDPDQLLSDTMVSY